MAPINKLILIYLAIVALLIISCNPIRKAERLVLNNRDASNRVFNTLALERPCANDTAFILNSDTITNTDTITNYKRDTINNIITLTEQGKTIYKTRDIVKIHTGYIVDVRKVAILMDSVRYYKVLYNTEHKYKQQAERRFWWLIIAIVGFIFLKRYLWSLVNTLH